MTSVEKTKERFLNGLLLALVVSSLVLSSRVWFPSERKDLSETNEAQVQVPPPAIERRMPEILRPERVVMKRRDGQAGILQVGSVPYAQAWSQTQSILARLRPTAVPFLPDELGGEKAERESLTLMMPVALRLSEWADHWGWNTVSLQNQSVRMDRFIFEVGKVPGILLAGPNGNTYRLGSLSDDEQKALQDFIKGAEPATFFKPRPLDVKDLPVRLAPGLQIPEVKEMPVARVKADKPVDTVEEARFFPDLSVVRQIEERDARSFTDGQRLLRLASTGLLEYRTADMVGLAPELWRALPAIHEWLGTHGGWPQALVMGRYTQESGKTRLQFEIRLNGPFPVESAGGAMQIELAATDRVAYFRRYPDLMEVTFERHQTPIIHPEEALRIAVEETPLFLFDTVRDVHAAYLLRPSIQAGSSDWVVEPAWVFLAGDTRLYVPAAAGLEKRALTQIRF